MKTLRAVLVDDEASARDVLANLLLRYCPSVELIAKCPNLPEAVELIKSEKPDLVFLDIEMPNYAGYEIISFFEEICFEIIFVTAYDKYALRAFEISAIDYLLKPIDINRLKQAISKVNTKLDLKHNTERLNLLRNTIRSKDLKSIIIPEHGNQYVLAIDSIVAIEAQESYCYIHTLEKKYTVSKNLKHFETIFSDNLSFIRVHKSWIIAKHQILNYSKLNLTICLTNGLQAKLSKYKKAEFEEALLS